MDKELSRQLQKGWDATCRVVMGKEIGQLEDYTGWLSSQMQMPSREKSGITGKEVILASGLYPKTARFASAEEVVQNRSYAISINDIKDLDTLLPALAERCEYSGNRFLGNTAFVDSSDLITNSQYVARSANVEKSSHVYLSWMIRKDSKYVFGSDWLAQGEFLIRVDGAHTLKRSLEAHYCVSSSDMHYCSSCIGCHDLMFSFGQRNKSHMIGNLALPKEKYAAIKAGLLGELAARLQKDKKLPALYSLVPNTTHAKRPAITPANFPDEKKPGLVRKGFAKTYAIIFKRQPRHEMEEYGGWLEEHTVTVENVKTPFGCTTPCPTNWAYFGELPRKRVVSIGELLELGKHPMREGNEKSLQGVLGWVAENFFFTAEFYDGINQNINETPCAYNAVNTYMGFDATSVENEAYSSCALNSKYVYGGTWILESEFCIKCYNSNFLTRCLEMDGCTKCADCYFCHNCEGLSDCMFCFNMKGARHCIGNTQLTREEYIKARDAILAKLADEMGRARGLKMSIYNIGASHGKRSDGK